MEQSFYLGVKKAYGEENKVISTSYVREKASYTKKDDHLIEGEAFPPV